MKDWLSGNVRIAGLALILVLALLGQTAIAQVTTARLEGVIKDQTDAVVPSVTVVATQTGTNITFEAISNEIGFYLFPRLPPGDYTVTAELTGFKKSINQGVHLQIGDTSTLNIKLQAGGTNETVTVTA